MPIGIGTPYFRTLPHSGANFHLVAIPEDRAEENIKKFGSFTSDLHRLAHWLSEHRINTVRRTRSLWCKRNRERLIADGQSRFFHCLAHRRMGVNRFPHIFSTAAKLQDSHSLRDKFRGAESKKRCYGNSAAPQNWLLELGPGCTDRLAAIPSRIGPRERVSLAVSFRNSLPFGECLPR
jgi:hypothetical protein